MNKRILSILLCLVLVVSLLVLAVPVNAAPTSATVTLTADKTTAKPGDDVTFTLTLGPIEDIGSIEFQITHTDDWTLKSAETASGLATTLGLLKADVNHTEAGNVRFTSQSGDAAGHTDNDVVLGTFTATLADSATGTINFDMDSEYNNYAENYDFTDVGLTFVPASVTVGGEATEPAPTEPAPTEPAPTEPAPTEPAPTEVAPTEPHVHDDPLTFVPEVPATTEKTGVAAHYICNSCGQLFADATVSQPVTEADLVIPVITPTEPAPTEAAPTEPAPTEPAPTEPAPTEPAPTEPAPTEPAPTEAAPTEPAPTEPAPTEPAPTEPAPTEPAPTEPAPTEAAPTEPAPTEAAPTEAAPTEPAPAPATSTYAFENSSYKYDHGDLEIILEGFDMYVHNTDATLDKDTASHFKKIVINGVEVTNFERDDIAMDGLRISIGRTAAEKYFHNGDNTVEVYFDDAASPATTTVQAVNLPEEPTEVTPADDKGATADSATKDSSTKDSSTKDSSTKDSASTPKTGDASNLYLWLIITLASLAGVVGVLYTAKRKGIFTK